VRTKDGNANDYGDLPMFGAVSMPDSAIEAEEGKVKTPTLKDSIPLDLENGEHCPTCGQFAKRYKRSITSGPARIAIWLSSNSAHDEWVHAPSVAPRHVLRSNEISRLKLWGLVEEKENTATSKKCSGFWKITEKGRDYAGKKIKLPKHCYVYHKEVLGFSEETADIVDALGDHFDYRELMRGEGKIYE